MVDDGVLAEGWGDDSETESTPGIPWLHVPVRGELRVAVVSESVVRYAGHWLGGGMRKCQGGTCGYCSRGIGSQWRTCFAVYDPSLRSLGCIELSKSAAGDLRAVAEEVGGLRGAGVRLFRDAEGVRGRIRVDGCFDVQRDPADLPEAPDVAAILRALWARQP